MKILLIAPTVHQPHMQRVSPFWLPPLGLATVAGLIPADFDVKIIDENVEDIDYNEDADLVGISFLTSQAGRAYSIADAFRKRNIPVVMGGYHSSALPEECKEHSDAVVIGEAEGNWPRLLQDFLNHNLQPFYRLDEFPSLANVPLPRRDLYRRGSYLTVSTIQTSRGCPYKCEFCNVSTFFGQKYRTKPVEDILKEIKAMDYKAKDLFFFVDDEITAEAARAKELFKALIPLNIQWWSQATLRNLSRDPELLTLAKESGCVVMVVGLESLVADNIKNMGKYQNNLEKYGEQIAKIQNAGILLNPSFTFGNDGDDESVFKKTLEFLEQNRIAIATFNILTPLPSTRLYRRLTEEGRLIVRDWSKYDMGHCVFEPRKMSAGTLEDSFNKLAKEFYSLPDIKKRLQYVPADKKSLIYGWNLGYKRLLDTFGVLM